MDTKAIKQVIDIFEGSNVHKMEIEAGEMKIKLEKEDSKSVVNYVKPQEYIVESQPVIKEDTEEVIKEEPKGNWVKSPIVGTFYSKPNESSPAYVNVGDSVNKGDIVCIIEAMKVMNEIKAPCSGKIISVAKQDGEMVQFDENLICIGD
ncbi:MULTISPECIES: acetyl-CoA carboxylase biotin carboxyl carrier protein [Anaerofustis]|uniref:acetyl-CoA carboxylase biotin carboxyl carrier protein n=1 Tax=Anaerofustis TaxID=264995 RepID=UPI001484E91F|nr:MULTISPECIES: acetyl-CoA carboxylase biotin carboxyl carrier protein [Anaerofustis]MCO8193951.1 acetyl-CoA carboxylase biotin carboxyl carrier protein [Anaerofustis sp. NSJ-163]